MAKRLVSPLSACRGRLLTTLYYIRTFLWPDVVLIEGTTEDGSRVSLLRAGLSDHQTAYYFSGEILDELSREQDLGRVWLWMLPTVARRLGCAFVALRVRVPFAALARRLLSRGGFATCHLPVFLDASVDISHPDALLRDHSLRDDVRKIRKYGFRSSVSKRQRDLATFITSYYKPHVRRAHGFDAIGTDLNKLEASCSNHRLPDPWELLKIEIDGKWVAAGLLLNGERDAALMEIGVLDGNPDWVKQGALQAVYWLALGYFHDQGHSRASLKYARPFLRNGVLQFKLKFHPSLRTARLPDGFLLAYDRHNDTGREILFREPLLAFDREGLRTLVFSPDTAALPEATQRLLQRVAKAGIERVERVLLRR